MCNVYLGESGRGVILMISPVFSKSSSSQISFLLRLKIKYFTRTHLCTILGLKRFMASKSALSPSEGWSWSPPAGSSGNYLLLYKIVIP